MAFGYDLDGKLMIGKVLLAQLAKEAGGPFFAYDWLEIQRRIHAFRESFTPSQLSIHYAMKANANPSILKRLASMGLGVDVVSAGELKQALAFGFRPENSIFSGVAKSEDEISFALENKIRQMNVESPGELARIAKIAKAKKIRAKVAFRINPDVDAHTHPYITTGFRENKFGMDSSFLPELEQILAENTKQICLTGLTIHIGSQLLDINCIGEAIDKTIPVYKHLLAKGHPLTSFDIGGGLGVDYQQDDSLAVIDRMQRYGKMVRSRLSGLNCEILCEPGRILVGPAGVLVGQVEYVKKTPHKNFLITNLGMHQLLRPALYQAHHRILPLALEKSRPELRYDIVGPICESADFLAKDRTLTELRPGEFLAVADAGAYGATMSSNYNAHPPAREFLVDGGHIERN